jgi:hypothetical protein
MISQPIDYTDEFRNVKLIPLSDNERIRQNSELTQKAQVSFPEVATILF